MPRFALIATVPGCQKARDNRLLALLWGVLLLPSLAHGQAQPTIITVAGGGGSNNSSASKNACVPLFSGGTRGSDVYLVSCNRIYKVTSAGQWTPVAGNGIFGFSGDGGPALNAQLGEPTGIFVDGAGNLFIADTWNHRIREVVAGSGNIQTVAGNGIAGFFGDGFSATSAELREPRGVFVDNGGNVFIVDTGNSSIREVVAATGIIRTVAGDGHPGFGGDGSPATLARLNHPQSVFLDSSNNIFVADYANNRVREVLAASGIINTVAGNGTPGFSGDGGLATNAQLYAPYGIFVDASNNLLIGDTANSRIREVDSGTGIIHTFAGNGVDGFGGDGGPATSAQISFPEAIFSNGVDIFVTGSFAVRKISAGIIQTFTQNGAFGHSGDGSPATSAQIEPDVVFVDSSGNIFVIDVYYSVIREILASTGIIETVAGNGTNGFSGDGGPATSAQLSNPNGIFVDKSGNIFIADSGNNRIREVTTNGVIQTIVGTGVAGYSGDGGPATNAQLAFPQGVFVDAVGNIFICDSLNSVIREVPAATRTIQTVAGNGTYGYSGDGGLATNATLGYLQAVFVDGSGNIFITDQDYDVIREVVASTGVIQTVAGNGTLGSAGDGGPATSAQLNIPYDAVVDKAGNIIIADSRNQRIRKVLAGSGLIQTIVGAGVEGFAGDGGPATGAELNWPTGVSVDSFGQLYIADSLNFRVRAVGSTATFGPPPPMVTVTAGQTAHFVLTLFGAQSSNLTFTMACSNLPPQASCSFAPAQLTPTPPPIGSQVQLTLSTQASSATPPSSRERPILFELLGVLDIILALCVWNFAYKKAPRRRLILASALGSLAMALFITGCSGSGPSTNQVPTGTPKGVANIVVTATSPSATVSTNVTVNVVQ